MEGESPVDLLRPSAPPLLTCCLLHLLLLHLLLSTMDSSGLLRGLLLVGLLCVLSHGQTSQEVSAEDFGADKPEPAADRDLVSTCQSVTDQ